MNYGKIIYDLLSAGTYVAFANKIMPVTIAQGTELPAIAYTKAVEPIQSFIGKNCIEDVNFNLYVFDDSPDDLDTLVQNIRKELEAVTTPYDNDTMTVQDITYIGTDHEGYDKDLFGDGIGRYFVVVKYNFKIKSDID